MQPRYQAVPQVLQEFDGPGPRLSFKVTLHSEQKFQGCIHGALQVVGSGGAAYLVVPAPRAAGLKKVWGRSRAAAGAVLGAVAGAAPPAGAPVAAGMGPAPYKPEIAAGPRRAAAGGIPLPQHGLTQKAHGMYEFSTRRAGAVYDLLPADCRPQHKVTHHASQLPYSQNLGSQVCCRRGPGPDSRR